jgi:NAD(P)-dependent dehydrogenase (short-subunit alcohol dehydrogenase family)
MQLKDASIVVTGAARGLGAALARELVSRGAQTVLADIDEADLSDLGTELEMPTMHCNVTDREQVRALGRAAIDEYGKIDIWLNNAGIWMPYTPVENLDFNKARQLIDVNYLGLAYGTVEALQHMRPRKSGIIANVLSVRALKGKALGAAYSASKFAAEGFTQAVRDELKDSGVSVLSFYPYRIKTTLFGENKHEDYEQSMEPSDVARVIVDNLAQEKPAEHVEIWSMKDVRLR